MSTQHITLSFFYMLILAHAHANSILQEMCKSCQRISPLTQLNNTRVAKVYSDHNKHVASPSGKQHTTLALSNLSLAQSAALLLHLCWDTRLPLLVLTSSGVGLALQIPIGGEDNFQGMVDLVRMKGITWDGEVTPTPLYYFSVKAFCLYAYDLLSLHTWLKFWLNHWFLCVHRFSLSVKQHPQAMCMACQLALMLCCLLCHMHHHELNHQALLCAMHHFAQCTFSCWLTNNGTFAGDGSNV